MATAAQRGELVELADTPDLGSGAYSVRVQVPYSPPLYFNKRKRYFMRYDVDRSKRTVTATIEGCESDLFRWVIKRFGSIDLSPKLAIALEEYSRKSLDIPNSFVGKAVCAEEDEFDVETGKILAARRAQEKYEKVRMRVLEEVTTAAIRALIEMNMKQNKRYNLARGKVLEAEQLVKMIGKV